MPARVDLVYGAATAACIVLVLAVHGFLPGMSQVPLTPLIGAGAVQCLADQGIESLWTWCMSLGLPVGAPRLTGISVIYPAWLLTYLPGVDAWAAHQIINAVYIAVALIAGAGILRRWGAPRWVALLFSTSYLTAINVIQLNGFGYTFLGYLLLPAYVWVALWVLDRLDKGQWAAATIVTGLLSLLMVFTEGYSFFAAGVVIGCLVLAWALRQGRARWVRGLAGVGLWTAVAGGAALLYAAWAPEGAFEVKAPLETFGHFGVDLVTLFVPRYTTAVMSALGQDWPVPDLWGDTTSVDVNYLGILMVGLALAYLVISGRSRKLRDGSGADLAGARAAPLRAQSNSELRAVAWAGAIALLLALGPVLKIGQVDPGLDAALLTLPSAWLYEHVPGLTEMRAVHRWLVVTRWSVLMLAAASVTFLFRRYGTTAARRTVIILVAVLAVVDTAPSVSWVTRSRQKSIDRVEYIQGGIQVEADFLIGEGERLLFLPASNDFLVNYLVPMIGAESYNVGIDKNFYYTTANWPPEVQVAVGAYWSRDPVGICRVLQGTADAVVLTYPSTVLLPLLSPLDPDDLAEREGVAHTLAEDPRFDAVVGEWMTVLRWSGADCDDTAGV